MSYSSEVLADAPLAYYRLGEASGATTMLDSSGNGHNGTHDAGLALGAAGAIMGDTDTAATYGSSRDSVVPTDTWMDAAASALTVEAWFKTTSTGIGTIVSRFGTATGQMFALDLQSSNVVRFYGKNSSGTTVIASATITGLRDGTWHHIAGTYDGANMRLYVDGTLRATQAQTGTLDTNPRALTVASRDSSNYLTGSVDEVALYPTALSATRIRDHYRAGLGAYAAAVFADAPLIYWKLDQGAGSGAAYDSSGNGLSSTPNFLGTYGAPGLIVNGGTAISCNGSNQGVEGGTQNGLLLDAAAQQTVELWIKTTQTAIADLAVTTSGGSLRLRINRVAGKVSLNWGQIDSNLYVDSTTTVNDDLPHHIVATITTTTATLYVDGVSQGSLSRIASGSAAPKVTHGYDSALTNDYVGVLDEIAWYTTALSATRVAAHYEAGTTIADPRDILGLVAWYSAEAVTGLADGATMTQWADLSGRSNHATAVGSAKPQWQATTGPDGGPAVHFIGTADRFLGGSGSSAEVHSYFALPTNLMSGAAEGEVIFQARRDTVVDNGNFGSLHAFSNPDYSFYTYTDGNIYDAFGSTARKDSIVPTMSTNVWRRVGIWSAANDWAFRLDGVTQHSTVTNTVGWFANPAIGVGAGPSGIPPEGDAASAPFKGWVSAVVLYNRKLTASERAALDAWLIANPSGGAVPGAPAVAADLAGSGSFTATVVVPEVNASLTGSGALTAVSTQVSVVTGSMTGASTFTAITTEVESLGVSIAGAGGFTATIQTGESASVTADLSGAGTFAATSYVVMAASASYGGESALTATSAATHTAVGAMTGAGTFTAVSVQVSYVSAQWSGIGNFHALGGVVGLMVRGFMRFLTRSGGGVEVSQAVEHWIVLPDGSAHSSVVSSALLIAPVEGTDSLQEWRGGSEGVVVTPELVE